MEAVIVATARTPIGRAGKGSLVDVPPRRPRAPTIVRALLAKVPGRRPGRGRGRDLGHARSPPARRGYNMARVVALLAGLDGVARHHRQPLLLVVAADDPHGGARDQGRRGRRVRRRRRRDREPLRARVCPTALPGTHNAKFADAEARTERARRRRADSWTPLDGPARHLHRDGPDRRERRRVLQRDPRGDGRVRVRCRSNRAVESQENGFFEREITPVTTPDGTVVSKDDGPRPAPRSRGSSQLKPVFRPDGTVTAGNACPLNDGAAAVLVMSEARAERARRAAVGADRRQRRDRARPRDHGARADRGVPPGAGAGEADDRRHRPRRDQRGVRRAGGAVGQGAQHPVGEAQRARRWRSRSATRSA